MTLSTQWSLLPLRRIALGEKRKDAPERKRLDMALKCLQNLIERSEEVFLCILASGNAIKDWVQLWKT